jgi:hypothetical protein
MNRASHISSAVLLLLILPLASVGVRADTHELRELGAFDSISVGGGIDVHLQIGDAHRVEVEADDADEVVTRVRGSTLEIQHQSHSLLGGLFHWGDAGEVYVTLPALRSLTAGGGSDVDSVGTLTGDALEISAAGGSDVDIDVAVTNLEISASGGSDFALSGSARFIRARASGGSDLDARDFTAEEADLQSSGGSDVFISVSRRLVARASGGSDIVYSGEPDDVDVDSSGGSDIRGR